ncbi:MAG: hypothetical protein AB7U85_00520 [Alphaproteobacteria bacterium]
MGITIKRETQPEKLLTPKEAGEYLQVAPATLEKWRMKKNWS